ncbi:MAG TPA: UDP-N-acetylglucosamine 2-epimerase (non-hydrolyzing), partial [Bacteroidota bacterium]
FFRELGIRPPDHNLGLGASRPDRVRRMIDGVGCLLTAQRPDWVLVYGDTDSTLAGTLAAARLRIPVAHVEAGVRSFNRAMPEEINRVMTDLLSDLLFCPAESAVRNLAAEGITRGVHLTGDVMLEALLQAEERALASSDILRGLSLREGSFILATVHRAENADVPERLAGILDALDTVGQEVVFPVHPRTRREIAKIGWSSRKKPAERGLRFLDPVGYLDMIMLERSALCIMTDSGGMQKEAYWLGVPCITLRDETEWAETVGSGWNVLAGADTRRILDAFCTLRRPAERPALYGEADPSQRCIELLESSCRIVER